MVGFAKTRCEFQAGVGCHRRQNMQYAAELQVADLVRLAASPEREDVDEGRTALWAGRSVGIAARRG